MKTATQRYEEAMDRLDDRFGDGRLHGEWVGSIEAAVAEERERCAAEVRYYLLSARAGIQVAHHPGEVLRAIIARIEDGTEAERSKPG